MYRVHMKPSTRFYTSLNASPVSKKISSSFEGERNGFQALRIGGGGKEGGGGGDTSDSPNFQEHSDRPRRNEISLFDLFLLPLLLFDSFASLYFSKNSLSTLIDSKDQAF